MSKLFALLLGCSFFLISADARAQTTPTAKEFSVAINVAGKQRMLSQKMSKEFLLVVLQADADDNKKNAAATMKLFGDNLKLLLSGDAERSLPVPPADVRAQLTQVDTLWTTFRTTLEGGLSGGEVAPATLANIQTQSETLLAEMNKAVKLYEDASKTAGFTTTGTVVNLAGKQRMLSQKMSKEICFIALNVDVDGNRAALQKDQELFAKTLKGLVKGDADLGLPGTSSESIVRQLEKVAKVWTRFEAIVQSVAKGDATTKDMVKELASVNPELLNEMNKAVTMFESEVSN